MGLSFLCAGVLISRKEGEALWLLGFMLGLILILVTLIGTTWLSASIVNRFRGRWKVPDG